MKYILITFLFPITLFSQETIDLNDFTNFKSFIDNSLKNYNEDSLNMYFEKYINEYRDSKGKTKIEYDSKIKVITKDQSDYCVSHGFVTHEQLDNLDKVTFLDRANFYKYNKELSGENLCSFGGYLSFYNEYKITNNFYEILSKTALKAWKESKNHNIVLLFNNVNNFAISMSTKGDNFYFCYLVGQN